MTPDRFIASAINDRKNKQKPFPLRNVPESFSAMADALPGVKTAGKKLALDHDCTSHIFDAHGGKSETLRGQIPVVSADLMRLADSLGAFRGIEAGVPPKSKGGAPRISGRVSAHEWEYFVVFEVRKFYVVPYTLWKRQK